jgi:LPPG:FO 2-phospho-L-lactate transferase
MKVTALAGGIGASKLLLGLQESTPPELITVIANTGDDIVLHGLRICPDIDTVTYTLAGVINPAAGWGLAEDSFECLAWLNRYGSPSWFKLGDRDLATHIKRTELLNTGRSLTDVTDVIRRALGVVPRILPMTDSYAPTRVLTDEGEMHLQEYMVGRKCEPRVREIRFPGIESVSAAPGVEQSIRDADAVIVGPSNPFISIGPILAVPGIRRALEETKALVLAITPIVGGCALKGPAANMLRDLGHEVSAAGVAKMYRDFADVFVLDRRDAALRQAIEGFGLRVYDTDTVMNSIEDKRRLALEVLDAIAGANPRTARKLQP